MNGNSPIRWWTDHGFTLLETLVALLIFAVAFGAIADIFYTGIRQARIAATLWDARALAEQQVTRFGHELPLEPGLFSGVGRALPGETPLAWDAEVKTVEAPGPETDLALFHISIEVREGGSDHVHFKLQTLKLGLVP
ncbi:MAG: type II secretion system protein [Pseudomonadota bacterium]